MKRFELELQEVVHAPWLAVLAGLVALVFLILLGYTFRDLREVRKLARVSGEADGFCHYSDAVAGSILACLVNGLFLSLFYYSYLWLFIALGVAIKRVATDQMTAMPRADAPVA